jgi:hypothetical protein
MLVPYTTTTSTASSTQLCQTIWGFTLDDFDDDCLVKADHNWLDELTARRRIDFSACASGLLLTASSNFQTGVLQTADDIHRTSPYPASAALHFQQP